MVCNPLQGLPHSSPVSFRTRSCWTIKCTLGRKWRPAEKCEWDLKKTAASIRCQFLGSASNKSQRDLVLSHSTSKHGLNCYLLGYQVWRPQAARKGSQKSTDHQPSIHSAGCTSTYHPVSTGRPKPFKKNHIKLPPLEHVGSGAQ